MACVGGLYGTSGAVYTSLSRVENDQGKPGNQGNDLALEKSGKLRNKNLETWKYQGNDFDPGKS